jgi:hypothetical protein
VVDVVVEVAVPADVVTAGISGVVDISVVGVVDISVDGVVDISDVGVVVSVAFIISFVVVEPESMEPAVVVAVTVLVEATWTSGRATAATCVSAGREEARAWRIEASDILEAVSATSFCTSASTSAGTEIV